MLFAEALLHARRIKRPLLAFNVFDLSSIYGVLEASRTSEEPVILQFSARTVQFAGASPLLGIARSLSSKLGVVAYVHLDHCRDDQVLAEAIDAGFDGVMADGSHLPAEANAEWTAGWRGRTRERGVALEAEFTAIRGEEDGVEGADDAGQGASVSVADYTEFCTFVSPDACSADVGTHHGHYRSRPALNFQMIEALAARPRPPFVIHGGSGLVAEELAAIAHAGVAKLNISTDLKDAWTTGLSSADGSNEPLVRLRGAMQEVRRMAESKWHANAN